jgi:hypothetical protein
MNDERLRSIFSGFDTREISEMNRLIIYGAAKRLLRTKKVEAQWMVSQKDIKKFIRFNLLSGKNRVILFSNHKMLSQIIDNHTASSPWFSEVQSRFNIEYSEEMKELNIKMDVAEINLISNVEALSLADKTLNKIRESEESKFKNSLHEIFKNAIERGTSFDQILEIWNNLCVESIHSN